MCVQIRTPRRQGQHLDAGCFTVSIEGRTEFRITTVQQIPTPAQKTEIHEGRVACHLRRQVLVAQEEFLVNGAGDAGEQSFPVHRSQANQRSGCCSIA
jgi:hypothetical protein